MKGRIKVGDKVYQSAAEAVRESGYKRSAIYNALNMGRPMRDGTLVTFADAAPREPAPEPVIPPPPAKINGEKVDRDPEPGSEEMARTLAEAIGHLFDDSIASNIVRGIAANIRLMAMQELERASRMERAADMIDSLKADAEKAANPEPLPPAVEKIAEAAAELGGGMEIAIKPKVPAPPAGITARDLVQCTILIDDNEHPDTQSAADSIDVDEDDLIAALVDGRTEFENHHIELGHEGLEEARTLMAA